MKKTGTPRALTKDDETLAVLVPLSATEDIFTTLSENEAFIKEAEEAKRKLADNPGEFINLTDKYAHLLKTH